MRSLNPLCFCLAIAGIGAVIALSTPTESPVDLSMVSVETRVDSELPGRERTKTVTVEFRRRNPAARFGTNQWVQTRIGRRWQEPERIPQLDGLNLCERTNRQQVAFIVPAQAEASRWLLEYRVGGSPYCRTYFFLHKHRVFQSFPKLCRLVLRCVPRQPRLRHVEPELILPVETRTKFGRDEPRPSSPL